MKKMILMAAVAAVAMSSCTNDENYFEDVKTPISFTPAAKVHQSRAIISSSEFPIQSGFGANAWLGKNTDGSNTQVYMKDVIISHKQDNSWKPETAYNWPPITGATLDFFCYAPETVKPTMGTSLNDPKTLTYTGITVDPTAATTNANDVDILYSDKAVNATSTNCSRGVPVKFNHALSTLAFKVLASTLEQENTIEGNKIKYEVKVQSIKLSKIVTKGNLTMKVGNTEGDHLKTTTWEKPENEIWESSVSDEDKKDYTISSDVTLRTDEAQPFGDTRIVLPQVLKGISATVKYTIKTTIGEVFSEDSHETSFNLTAMNSALTHWQMGKAIVYAITFNPTNTLQPITFKPSVNEWGVANGASYSNSK